MYTSTLKFSHYFTHGLHFIRHHRWMTIIGIVVIFLIVYALDIRIGDQTFFRFAEHAIVPAESATPLTRLADPQYANEYETRVQYIYEQLGTLKDTTGAERIYVFSYTSGDPLTQSISNVFEVGPIGETPHFNALHGLPIPTWEQMDEAAYKRYGLYPFRYSTELYNINNMMIGSFGIEFMKPVLLLQDHQLLERIRHTMRNIESALSQSFEDGQGS